MILHRSQPHFLSFSGKAGEPSSLTRVGNHGEVVNVQQWVMAAAAGENHLLDGT